MAIWKKIAQGAAGAAGGAALNVEDVFSTYLYDGNQTARTITNGIDLAGEGGLTWITPRTTSAEHQFIDSERGVSPTATPVLISSLTNGQINRSGAVTAYNSDGFDLGTYDATNYTGRKMASWTFRKAPKFFTCVTYSGTGSAQNISHDLGSDVGFMVVKRTDTTGYWIAWHKDFASTADGRLLLNTTDAYNTSSTYWNSTAPTSTGFTVGTNVNTNASGGTYVAYLFAHNNGDGNFGPTGDQDIIKCGSYTSNETSPPEINLGFEPQWILIKKYSAAYDEWVIFDNMRGVASNANDAMLRANTSQAEYNAANQLEFTSTGFKLTTAGLGVTNAPTGEDYIYIAIRRGPMAVPTDATDVFNIAFRGTPETAPPTFNSGMVTDFAIWSFLGVGPNEMNYRLAQNVTLDVDSSASQHSQSSRSFDYMDGFGDFTGTNTSQLAYMWKRAPSFCDVIAYKGNSSTNTLNHNLGVAPEMIWYKARDGALNWRVHANLTSSGYDRLVLDSNAAKIDTETYGTTKELVSQPTATQLVLGSGSGTNNSSSYNYIAYLFASLDGVSKVGSYTGNGTSQTIDCGFSNGARFVLIKQTNASGADWFMFDSTRGIVSGNDRALRLNSTASEVTDEDAIDPVSSGFSVTNSGGYIDTNNSGGTYIFYAIA